MKINYNYLKNKKNKKTAIDRCLSNRHRIDFLADRHWIVPLLIPMEKIKVLEIGGGSLFSYNYVLDDEKKKIIEYNVYDKSPPPFAERVNFIKFDPDKDNFPIKDSKFDFVIAMDVIEHVIDSNKFICEMKRILKNDGAILLTTPNYSNFKFTLKLIAGHMAHNPLGSKIERYTFREHVKYFTNRDFYPYIESFGLSCDAKIYHSLKVSDTLLNNNLIKRLFLSLYNLLPYLHGRFSHSIIGVFTKKGKSLSKLTKIYL